MFLKYYYLLYILILPYGIYIVVHIFLETNKIFFLLLTMTYMNYFYVFIMTVYISEKIGNVLFWRVKHPLG